MNQPKQRPTHVSAIVLAAGTSSRMGAPNKLLLPMGPSSVARETVERLLAAGPAEAVVVLGYQADLIREALADLPVRFVTNPHYETGMASSLACGVAHAAGGASGFLICLADMPRIRTETFARLLEAHRDAPDGSIVRPNVDGHDGQPVLFDAVYRRELTELQGDQGGKALLGRHAAHVRRVPVQDAGILQDIDTPLDLPSIGIAMVPALQPLFEQFKLNTRLAPNCLDGMNDETAQFRPADRANHAAFIAIHLVDARHFLARELGSSLPHPFGERFDRVRQIDDVDEWPSIDDIRRAWQSVSEALAPLLSGLGAEDLATEVGHKFPVDDRSLLGTIAFLLQHEAYHIGQLALLRKACGLPEMRYGRR